MEAWQEKNLLDPSFPFKLIIDGGKCPVSHHWHDEVEIIYMTNGSVKVGVNNKMYNIKAGDILLISSGDIHCFLPDSSIGSRIVIQFNLAIFDSLGAFMNERKEIRPLFDCSKRLSSEWRTEVKQEMENQIKGIFEEYNKKEEGYKLALKARLYDLVVLLLRKVPMERLSFEEENRHREALGRLENIFRFVEDNYLSDISLEEAAKTAGFSVYHFTRFFKMKTGITFGQYLSSFRVTKAEWLLMNNEHSITEIAYKCGFNSVKTFNRVFKQLKGYSPSEYKKQNMRTS
ncbi:AraC family transcriptional regulator [Clostridium swellfunianum]|uniref:AraC family transcriptional regulator n=1 Tax=Clostridium swellfunianum TaxID=1367462 RepID=UPI00202F711B|nr:AraC family transcriptional regulator [Clostridium swellfunianum]MCM0650851.1 AraC family transcriptional regulator [Clostridium swellfunianum]